MKYLIWVSLKTFPAANWTSQQTVVFWAVTQCNLQVNNNMLKKHGCSQVTPKCWYPLTGLHGITIQKTAIWSQTAIKSWRHKGFLQILCNKYNPFLLQQTFNRITLYYTIHDDFSYKCQIVFNTISFLSVHDLKLSHCWSSAPYSQLGCNISCMVLGVRKSCAINLSCKAIMSWKSRIYGHN